SILKVGIFLALAALLAWGAGYVIETPGRVQIAFAGREILLEPFDFLLVLMAAFGLLWLLVKLAGFLVAVLRTFGGEKTAIVRYFDRNRERRGFEALVQGMIALASGEGREALYRAAKAERLLDRPDLTRLISAQAAELAGNAAKAEEYYKQLVEDDRTRFVGVRGLMRQKLEEGKPEVALKLAQKAFALKPGHAGVIETLFGLQVEAGDWAGARKTLEAKVRARLLPRDVGARRDAVLSLAEAREAEIAGDLARARQAAYAAIRLAPALVPAAVTAARLKAGEGDKRAADRILRKAWEAEPHPDLGAAYAALEPDESPAMRLKRFKPLLALKPDHPEARLLAAELALAAEDFPEARRALGDLAEKRPTTRTLAIMAAVERGEGAPEAVVRGWLARALGASRGEQWVCGKCRHVHAGWAPVCENCEAFDTLAWSLPPLPDGADRAAAAMLPLIVGEAAATAEEPEGPEPAAATEGRAA
ncbi:MAG TPA: heme biosynthesis HemY N-terminal domain-containing protein, partial [Paracoccaceae bacterium]|nr:heme biosynthesis HemY N-terminal domain-containing protein [Paracoccaceae bacterium]